MIEIPAPIANLFTRADEGLARLDWKFAIDSLQRIIDDPQAALVRREDDGGSRGIRYESARRRATRRIAALPAEGLQAYRLLFDGKAKGLLERAAAAHNADDLRLVVERHLLTRYGDDAADLLASWALDEGRPDEAAAVLEEVRALVPDRDVPEVRTVSKLLVAYLQLGQPDNADALLEDCRKASALSPDELAFLNSLPESVARQPTATAARSVAPVEVWPMAGGTADRRGVMPEVMPTLTPYVPWVFTERSATATWAPAGGEDAWPTFPAAPAVADGGRLFVRSGGGCRALDAEDLAPLWEASTEHTGPTRSGLVGRGVRQAASVWEQQRSGNVHDDALELIATHRGLVMTIDRTIDVEDFSQVAERTPFLRPAQVATVADALTRSNRLTARDAQSGEVRWRRGRQRDIDDPLGDVVFRGVPLAVGDELWVPYLQQNGLLLAVLAPTDGSLIRTIPLCSFDPRSIPMHGALMPAHARGVVYVPSGQGVLFAVGASDHSPRWATLYATTIPPALPGEEPAGRRRAVSPPIVAGGLVLLAPPDLEELIAFDASTGAIRWSVALPEDGYLIAADATRVWIGGRGISCRAAVNGDVLWAAPIPSNPTGRAVLCGRYVQVPMASGLLSLEADSGAEARREALPESQPPLGGLLCLHDALYTTDHSGVRKFADTPRMYARASRQVQADPSDLAAAITLARLELLRDAPARAYEVLDAATATTNAAADSRRAATAARTRVEAALALAQKAAPGSDEALAWVDRAAEGAVEAEDRLRCALARVDHQAHAGRYLEAARSLWTLSTGGDAEAFVNTADGSETPARREIARRLATVTGSMSAADRDVLSREVEGTLADVVRALSASDPRQAAPSAAQQLRTVAQMSALGPVAGKAALTLGAWCARSGRLETGEQHLRAAVQADVAEDVTLAALMRLCELYRYPGLSAERLFGDTAGVLSARFAHKAVPEEVVRAPLFPTPDAAGAGAASPSGTAETVAAWLERAGWKPPQIATVGKPGERRPLAARLTGAPAWSRTVGVNPLVQQMTQRSMPFAPQFVQFDDDQTGALADRVLVIADDQTVSALSIGDGTELWRTTLRLPESTLGVLASPGSEPDSLPRRAVVDGQTVVLAGDDGLFAVGLLTGKRLWLRRFEPLVPDGSPVLQGMAMDAGEGMLAAVTRAGRLELMHIADGTVVWRRDLRGEPADHVRLAEGLVLVSDRRRERVNVFEAATGRLLTQVQFHQPDPERSQIALVLQDRILCGPRQEGTETAVACVRAETGEPIWRLPLSKPLAQLFEPGEGFIGISELAGDVRIVRTATGEVLLDRRVPGAQAVEDATLIDTVLLAWHAEQRQSQTFPAVTAVDVATGEKLWNRGDLRTLAGTGRIVRLMGGRIPAVIEMSAAAGMRGQKLAVAVIDSATGETVGPVVDLPAPESQMRVLGDMVVRPGVIVVRVSSGWSAFGWDLVDPAWEAGR